MIGQPIFSLCKRLNLNARYCTKTHFSPLPSAVLSSVPKNKGQQRHQRCSPHTPESSARSLPPIMRERDPDWYVRGREPQRMWRCIIAHRISRQSQECTFPGARAPSAWEDRTFLFICDCLKLWLERLHLVFAKERGQEGEAVKTHTPDHAEP